MIGYTPPPHENMHSWASGTARVPAAAQRALDGFERYGRILASQLDAISDVPDLETFSRLAKEGDALARELDDLAAGGARDRTPPHSTAATSDASLATSFQDSLRRRIEECLVTDGRIRERLRALRDHAAGAMATFDQRRPGLDRYAEEPAPRLRVDLRS